MLLTIFNVLLGLCLSWFALSLAALYIQEWLATRFRWRASMLETSIKNLLVDSIIVDQFYNHPIIRSLYSGEKSTQKPSYIPAREFSLALFDIVMSAGTEAALLQRQIYKLKKEIAVVEKQKREEVLERINLLLALTRRVITGKENNGFGDYGEELIKTGMKKLAADYPQLGAQVEDALEETNKLILSLKRNGSAEAVNNDVLRIQQGLAALGVINPRLKQTLGTLFIGQEDGEFRSDVTFVKLQQSVELWFENSMTRVSGGYKRHAQVWSIMIGILLTVLLNVDAFQLTKYFWKEPKMQEALMQTAETYLGTYQGDLELSTDQVLVLRQDLFQLGLPFGWFGSPIDLVEDVFVSPEAGVDISCSLVPTGPLALYGIRMGNLCYPLANTPMPSDGLGWVLKIMGLIVTSLATAQGAPFWFEILKKIINVRISGLSPAENPAAVG
jgi:hypothetical protein